MINFSQNITIDKFIQDGKNFAQNQSNFNIEKHSDYISYPEFLRYFEEIRTIDRHNLIIGINFTYGWMPTIFDFRSSKFTEAIEILNRAKEGSIPSINELNILKELFNNSLVGTSKLLHFINPKVFAIWDSRVYYYLTRQKAHDYRIGNPILFLAYLDFIHSITSDEKYDEIHREIVKKIKYKMTKLRTADIPAVS